MGNVGTIAWVTALLGCGAAQASSFTPLAWKQEVRHHANRALVGQQKHLGWPRDRNMNLIDDDVELHPKRFGKANIAAQLNDVMPPAEIRRTFGDLGRVRYIGKLVTFLTMDDVKLENV